MTDGAPDGLLGRQRARVEGWLAPWQRSTPGRLVADTVARTQRVEIFDRAMVIAAQVFTSVVPILILLAVAARGTDVRDALTGLGTTPGVTQVVDDALGGGASIGSFGFVGIALVLLSSTSLSRALARVYASVWDLPRPGSRPSLAWRWLAVAVGFALSVLAVRLLSRLGELIPPAPLWSTVAVALGYGLLLWPASRVLVDSRVGWRGLLPGALLGGLVIAVVSRVSQALWLPAALSASEARYGTIGVAFTYISLLYVIAWGLIAAIAVGAALVQVDGPVARWAAEHEEPGQDRSAPGTL